MAKKYIDAEKLEERVTELIASTRQKDWPIAEYYLKRVIDIIDSVQQEQSEDIVVIAKTFLGALSKTPYNNKPITDAQIIVRQLLLFFENPKEYNPDAILEQPEVDLEKEYKEYVEDDPVFGKLTNRYAGLVIARHFYELGLNARKEVRYEYSRT